MPRAAQPNIPLLVVGGSQQSIPWIAEHLAQAGAKLRDNKV
ncbi:hypothetical protein [Ruegeria arenilitoris]|nr:hypothetical protein [Ruegeria arenilitoris]